MDNMPFEGYYRHLLNAIMRQQMGEAQGVSDAVPRGDPMRDLYYSLPEMHKDYQPSNYYNYGKPVRVG